MVTIMILSPQLALDNNILTSPEKPFDDDQIQQHGVDVRVHKMFKIANNSLLVVPGKKPDFRNMDTDEDGYYHLRPLTAYSVLCHEFAEIPWHLGAEVIIRSTLNRNGVFGRSSWYDPGFRNYVGFTMYPFLHVMIKQDERVGQIIFTSGQPANLYNGKYSLPVSEDVPKVDMFMENDGDAGE